MPGFDHAEKFPDDLDMDGLLHTFYRGPHHLLVLFGCLIACVEPFFDIGGVLCVGRE
jgi:hypothetical protein